MIESPVERWFGKQFGALHPLLQRLHRHGGVLRGPVEVGVGRGPAAVLGRHLAARMGLPVGRPGALEVRIAHDGQALLWQRRFIAPDGQVREAPSVFRPVGTWPDGHWDETTGALRMRLTVDVERGGWQWRVLGARLGWLPVPVALFPRSRAGKWVDDQGRYRFEVAFEAPLLGPLLWYRGTLDAVSDPV